MSWTAYLGSAILGALDSGREAMEVLGVAAAGTAVFFGRSLRSGTSLHGALLGASLFTLVILGITWGRPSRMFDLRPPHPDELPMTAEAERSRRRQNRRVRLHQAAFLAFVLCFFTLYGLSGATFLN